MRLWSVGLIVSVSITMCSVLLLPSVSLGAQRYRHEQECKRITRQISHYSDVVAMAKQRDDDLWEDATKAHMKRLAARREHLCPNWGDEARFKRAMAQANEILKSAAQTAVRYFTFGAY